MAVPYEVYQKTLFQQKMTWDHLLNLGMLLTISFQTLKPVAIFQFKHIGQVLCPVEASATQGNVLIKTCANIFYLYHFLDNAFFLVFQYNMSKHLFNSTITFNEIKEFGPSIMYQTIRNVMFYKQKRCFNWPIYHPPLSFWNNSLLCITLLKAGKKTTNCDHPPVLAFQGTVQP